MELGLQAADWLAVEIRSKKMKYTRKGAVQVEVEVTEDGDRKYKFTGGTATVTGENPFATSMTLIIILASVGGVLVIGILIAIFVLSRKRAARLGSSSRAAFDSFDSRLVRPRPRPKGMVDPTSRP
jgi:hypothetical protein